MRSVSQACSLVLEQVDIESRILHFDRLKVGLSATHPLIKDNTSFERSRSEAGRSSKTKTSLRPRLLYLDVRRPV
jgi:hypothetical protein